MAPRKPPEDLRICDRLSGRREIGSFSAFGRGRGFGSSGTGAKPCFFELHPELGEPRIQLPTSLTAFTDTVRLDSVDGRACPCLPQIRGP